MAWPDLTKAFVSRTPRDVSCSSQIETDGYLVGIYNAHFARESEGAFTASHFYIEGELTQAQPIWSAFGGDAAPQWARVGRIMFAPAGQQVKGRVAAGMRRTISCLFDLEKLGFAESAGRDWSGIDAAKAFDIRNPFVHMAMMRLAQEVTMPSQASRLIIEGTLHFLVAELHGYLDVSQPRSGQDRNTLSSNELAVIDTYLETGNLEVPTISEIASSIDMSAQTLSQRFREATGQTLRTYISNAKIRRAQRLLVDPHLQMKQVAHLSGFKSSAAFSSAFRKEVGMAPTEFQQGFSLP